jgi:hypothetical protein
LTGTLSETGYRTRTAKKRYERLKGGLIDADLGSGLIKQRIPRGNQSAARGSRAVVFYKRGRVAVFLHIFPKSRKANLSKSDLAEYVKAAHVFEKLNESDFVALQAAKGWRVIEI